MRQILCLAILPFVLIQCATVTSGTSQAILVDVLNAQGTLCRGTDKAGRQYIWADTPSSTTVHKGDGPMTLICEKEGFQKTTMTFDEELAGATMGNIILGGGIGILVDTMSGAAQEYPSKIQLVMKPLDTAPQAAHDDYQTWKEKLEVEQQKQQEEALDEEE